MKVLLKEDVENLGYAGEVHKVAPGFGRNYLIPRGLAEVATPKALEQARAWRARAEARRAQIRSEYQGLAEKISALKLDFKARAGETGKLYGSITTHDIADKLNAALGIDIDRRKIESPALRQLGEHSVVVRLDKLFRPELKVVIHSQEEDDEAAGA